MSWPDVSTNYPNNADGDALRRVSTHGLDMSRPMAIDFFVAVPDRKTGIQVADAASSLGYEISVEQDEESGNWTCYCMRTMLATYDGVVSAQDELDKLAKSFAGCAADGWGTPGNGKAG